MTWSNRKRKQNLDDRSDADENQEIAISFDFTNPIGALLLRLSLSQEKLKVSDRSILCLAETYLRFLESPQHYLVELDDLLCALPHRAFVGRNHFHECRDLLFILSSDRAPRSMRAALRSIVQIPALNPELLAVVEKNMARIVSSEKLDSGTCLLVKLLSCTFACKYHDSISKEIDGIFAESSRLSHLIILKENNDSRAAIILPEHDCVFQKKANGVISRSTGPGSRILHDAREIDVSRQVYKFVFEAMLCYKFFVFDERHRMYVRRDTRDMGREEYREWIDYWLRRNSRAVDILVDRFIENNGMWEKVSLIQRHFVLGSQVSNIIRHFLFQVCAPVIGDENKRHTGKHHSPFLKERDTRSESTLSSLLLERERLIEKHIDVSTLCFGDVSMPGGSSDTRASVSRFGSPAIRNKSMIAPDVFFDFFSSGYNVFPRDSRIESQIFVACCLNNCEKWRYPDVSDLENAILGQTVISMYNTLKYLRRYNYLTSDDCVLTGVLEDKIRDKLRSSLEHQASIIFGLMCFVARHASEMLTPEEQDELGFSFQRAKTAIEVVVKLAFRIDSNHSSVKWLRELKTESPMVHRVLCILVFMWRAEFVFVSRDLPRHITELQMRAVKIRWCAVANGVTSTSSRLYEKIVRIAYKGFNRWSFVDTPGEEHILNPDLDKRDQQAGKRKLATFRRRRKRNEEEEEAEEEGDEPCDEEIREEEQEEEEKREECLPVKGEYIIPSSSVRLYLCVICMKLASAPLASEKIEFDPNQSVSLRNFGVKAAVNPFNGDCFCVRKSGLLMDACHSVPIQGVLLLGRMAVLEHKRYTICCRCGTVCCLQDKANDNYPVCQYCKKEATLIGNDRGLLIKRGFDFLL